MALTVFLIRGWQSSNLSHWWLRQSTEQVQVAAFDIRWAKRETPALGSLQNLDSEVVKTPFTFKV